MHKNGQKNSTQKANNMTVAIYHNPRCSKSRQTLQLLQDRGIDLTIIDYQKTPPSADEIKSILKKLGLSARHIIRKGEDAYKQHNLDDKTKTEDDLIKAMITSPKLIERPIVVAGEKATIGRPPESVLDIL